MKLLFSFFLVSVLLLSPFHLECSNENIADNTLFVSPNGDDQNAGSINEPFKTIAVAAKVAKPGTIIYLRAGNYNEVVRLPSGSSKAPLIISAYEDENPVISGLDPVSGWEKFKGNIYYAVVAKPVSQLFIGKQPMIYARWPNLTSSDLLNQKYAIASSITFKSHGRNSLITDENLLQLKDLDISGAKISLPYPLAKAWNGFTEEVVDLAGNTLQLTSNGYFTTNGTEAVVNSQARNIVNTAEGLFHELASDVNYFLSGKFELLDAEDEWFYDEKSKRLYIYLPDGSDPGQLKISARTRLNGLVVNGSYVQVRGIEFFAASAKVRGDHNLIEDSKFLYPRPFYTPQRFMSEAGVLIIGKFNSIKKCEVAHSWGTGISMIKSEDGLIEDCLVHQCNWSGSNAPCVEVDGHRMTVRKNTIFGCGRSGIRHYSVYSSLFEKNHVYDYGKINRDLGGIKGGLQDYENSIWRFNYLHCEISAKATAGIYLDASNDNALVHHNVLHNVHLSINGEVNNNSVFNNTLVSNVPEQKVWSHYQRYPDWDYRSVHTWNNLATNTIKGTSLENNLIVKDIDSIGFVGHEYGDFRLAGYSAAIDNARKIDEITNETAGVAPDIGAYEYGSDTESGNWISGITWSPSWNKLPEAQIQAEKDQTNGKALTFSVKNESDKDGWIMRFDWDFGDGITSYGKTVSHTYEQPGIYQVKLFLQDNLAGKTQYILNVEIK